MSTINPQVLALTIKNDLQKLSQNITQIQQFNQQAKGREISTEMRDKILKTEENIKNLLNLTKKNIQDLSTNPSSRSGELKIQKDRLMDEMIKAVQRYKIEIQVTFELLDRYKNQAKPSSNQNSNILIENETEGASYVRYNNSSVENDNYQVQAQLQSNNQLELAVERNKQMKGLERDIVDLNSMFKDLSLLVHDQGEIIDTIEKNIDNAHQDVIQAKVELGQGVKYASKARSKKCCLFITIILVLIVISAVILIALRPWT